MTIGKNMNIFDLAWNKVKIIAMTKMSSMSSYLQTFIYEQNYLNYFCGTYIL